MTQPPLTHPATNTDCQRSVELERETASILCGAVNNGLPQLSTVRRNLEADELRRAEICGHDKHESELRDLQYRINVRRTVLAAFEGDQNVNQ